MLIESCENKILFSQDSINRKENYLEFRLNWISWTLTYQSFWLKFEIKFQEIK